MSLLVLAVQARATVCGVPVMPVPEVLRTQADAYLTALVIFVAPVLAVDAYLAKYRAHGKNLFHGAQLHASASKLENRMAMRSALVAETSTM